MMLRPSFSFLFLAFTICATLASSIFDVSGDLKNIAVTVRELDGAISNFPDDGGTLSGALKIKSGLSQLEKDLNKGTADVNAFPDAFSSANSKIFLTSIQNFKPIVERLLINVVKKKESIKKIPIPIISIVAAVRQALESLKASQDKFLGAMNNKYTGNDVKAQGEEIKSDLDKAFQVAIKGYS